MLDIGRWFLEIEVLEDCMWEQQQQSCTDGSVGLER